jgi:tRNA(fMet)-specific endonuclease VapC
VDRSLLDTDTLSGINKARDEKLLNTAERYLALYGSFTFSSVTVMEVVRGYVLARRIERLLEFLNSLANHNVLSFSSSTGELAGEIDAKLMQTGQPIGRADPMIAATAVEHSLVLVTSNINHFERIQDLGYPLRVEDWRGA